MEQKNENKAKIWNLPDNWHPELTKGARKLYGRLMCLTSAGTKPCTYTNKQCEKELSMCTRTAIGKFQELANANLIATAKVNNTFGNGVREVTLDASLAPKSASAKTGEQVQMQVQNQVQMQVQNAPLNAPMQVQMHVQKNVKIAPPKSAMTLEYARPDGDSPYLILKRNKELLISGYSVLFSKAPEIATNTCTFDLSNLLEDFDARKNVYFTPWGAPHDGKFDFTGLWDMVTYPDEGFEALKSADPKTFAAFNKSDDPTKDKDQYWRQFFIMTALIELTCFKDSMFYCIEKYDPSGRNFRDFYFKHQIGFPFVLINTVYAADDEGLEKGELDGQIVYKSIKDRYVLGKGDLLSFTQGYLWRQALHIINNPELCEKAYLGWRLKFYETMNTSFPCWTIKDLPCRDVRYLQNYFHPDLARYILCEEKGISPRWMFPTLLFRRLITIHSAARLKEDGITELTNRLALDLIKTQRTKESVRKEWDALCECLADVFPFMNQEGVFEHV